MNPLTHSPTPPAPLTSAAQAAPQAPAGMVLHALPKDWTPGASEFKDWCARWFGPDADDGHLLRAAMALLEVTAAKPAPAQQADNWRQYATERDDKAQQVIERHRGEQDSLLRLLAKDRATIAELRAAQQAKPHGWVTMWPAMGGGYKPIYSPGVQKPSYGPELNALLHIYPVFTEQAAPAPQADTCPTCGSDCNERDELIKAEREIERLRATLADHEAHKRLRIAAANVANAFEQLGKAQHAPELLAARSRCEIAMLKLSEELKASDPELTGAASQRLATTSQDSASLVSHTRRSTS